MRRPTQCNRMSTTMTMTTSMTNIVKHSDVLKMCVMRSPCLRHHISNKVQIVPRARDRRHLQYSVFVPLMTFIISIHSTASLFFLLVIFFFDIFRSYIFHILWCTFFGELTWIGGTEKSFSARSTRAPEFNYCFWHILRWMNRWRIDHMERHPTSVHGTIGCDKLITPR